MQHAAQLLVQRGVVPGELLEAGLRCDPVAVGEVAALRGVDRVIVELGAIVLAPVWLPVRSGAAVVHPLGVSDLAAVDPREHRVAHRAALAGAAPVETSQPRRIGTWL